MGRIHYSVVAELPDDRTRTDYLDWLAHGHLQGVLEGGAELAQVLEMDGSSIRVQTRYEFPDRQAFERYEREFAPALRADGLARFGSIPNVRFERSVAEQIAEG